MKGKHIAFVAGVVGVAVGYVSGHVAVAVSMQKNPNEYREILDDMESERVGDV